MRCGIWPVSIKHDHPYYPDAMVGLLLVRRLMSEFEIFEAMMIAMNLAVTASMNFVAIVFAYLVAAFVAGKSLPRGVAIGTSLIYTVFLIPPFNGTINNLRRVYDGDVVIRATYPESWLVPSDPTSFELLAFLFAFPMLAGWLGSLYYMHLYTRRDSNQTDDKGSRSDA